jgi:hypothetical protein
MLSSRLGQGLPSGPFMTLICYEFLFFPACYISLMSHPPWFVIPVIFTEEYKIMKLRIAILSIPTPWLIHLS